MSNNHQATDDWAQNTFLVMVFKTFVGLVTSILIPTIVLGVIESSTQLAGLYALPVKRPAPVVAEWTEDKVQ